MRQENCMKCYPRMCRCPLSDEQRIEAIILCLASSLWDEDEQLHHRRRLTRLIPLGSDMLDKAKEVPPENLPLYIGNRSAKLIKKGK